VGKAAPKSGKIVRHFAILLAGTESSKDIDTLTQESLLRLGTAVI